MRGAGSSNKCLERSVQGYTSRSCPCSSSGKSFFSLPFRCFIFSHYMLFQATPNKKELITMGPFEALKRFPVFVARNMGPNVGEPPMLGQDEKVRTPKDYFMTDMFAVKRSTFVDRDDARLIQVAQAPRLTCGDVTKFGQYLASQIQASSKDVSYIICLSHNCVFFHLCVCRGEILTRHMLASCKN